MFKCYSDEVPGLFNTFFTSVTDVHSYETRRRNNLYCPKTRTNLGMTGLSYRGPFIWNKVLETGINPNTCDSVFCRKVKEYIMDGKI